jgi:hypothetical protein
MFLFSSRINHSLGKQLMEAKSAANPWPRSSAGQREDRWKRSAARNCSWALIFPLLFAVLPAWGETVPSGTEITIRLEQDIQPVDKKYKGSDKFSAPLAFPVFADGREVVPAGSKIEGEVRGSKKTIFLSPRYLILPDGRKLDFNATVSGINQRRLKAEEKEGTIEKKSDRGAAAQQAGEIGSAGAVIGALSTYTWEGMAIGAAIGVGGVLIGRKIAGHGDTAVIPAGTQLTLDLNQPLTVPDDASEAQSPENQAGDREDQRPTLRRGDPEPAPDTPTQ